MKKLFYLLFVLLVGCLVSCDKEEPKEPEKPKREEHGDSVVFSHYVWVNESDHLITLYIKARSDKDVEEIVLHRGESTMREDVGIFSVVPPENYFGSLRVLFDDGPYEWTYGWGINWPGERPDHYTALYDPTFGDVFYREPFLIESGDFANYDAVRWTYTFTNADYDAVVSYWPWKEAQEQVSE